MITSSSRASPLTDYEIELSKTQRDVAALKAFCFANPADVEKHVRLAYRQFHTAALTDNECAFKEVEQTIKDVIARFGPKEDICILKANLDDRFHRLQEVKSGLRMCPRLAERFEGRSILAGVDFQEGRYDKARRTWERLIEERRTWDNLARLANWYFKMDEHEEADNLYAAGEEELTAKEMRSFAWIELQRGAVAATRGSLERARSHYDRATAAFSGDWRVDVYCSELLALEGKLTQAVTLLENVIARAPKPEFKQALGELLRLSGRNDEAQPLFEAALTEYLASVSRQDVHYFHHLVDFYAELDRQPIEAVKWARRDVELRSNFSTQSALAYALLKNRELPEALKWIGLALSSGARDGSLFRTAAAVFQSAGDTIQAERYSRAAAGINPNGAGLHLHH